MWKLVNHCVFGAWLILCLDRMKTTNYVYLENVRPKCVVSFSSFFSPSMLNKLGKTIFKSTLTLSLFWLSSSFRLCLSSNCSVLPQAETLAMRGKHFLRPKFFFFWFFYSANLCLIHLVWYLSKSYPTESCVCVLLIHKMYR